MAPNEKENIYNVQGYLKANMIVLHSSVFDHMDGDRYIYVPRLFVVNSEQICALEEKKLNNDISKETQLKTKIYFINREYEEVYESIGEVLDLISQQLEIQEHFKK